MEWNIESILLDLGTEYRTEGQQRKTTRGIASINQATLEDLSFCSYEGNAGVSAVLESRAGIILCKKSMQGFVYPREGSLLIFLENPRLAFIQVVNQMYKKKQKNKISPRAIISDTAQIGSNCFIGDYTVIGDYCKIGSNTVIHDRVSLVQNCVVGNNSLIQSGATLGCDGFNFEKNPQTLGFEHFPSFGRVIIGQNTQISANCSIAAGTLSDTLIGDGTKLDALVHVGHDARIGRNCVLTASTVIGGSTIVCDDAWFGLNCTVKNKIKIGKKAIIGCGATVIRDVVDGDIVAGVPAKSIKFKVTSKQFLSMTKQSVNDQHARKTRDSHLPRQIYPNQKDFQFYENYRIQDLI